MSASLVGSEMCIRDSALLLGLLPLAAGVNRGQKGSNKRVVALPARFLHPVSYTHLTLPTICSV
eukprot:14124565-Alexandrium_andersonii.AAC.1